MNCTLKAIGKDIFSKIFNELEFCELLHCRLVCKEFCEYASGDLSVTRVTYEDLVSVKKLTKTGNRVPDNTPPICKIWGLPVTMKDEMKFERVIPQDKIIVKGFFKEILKVLKSPERLLQKINAEIKTLERALKSATEVKTIRKEIEELIKLKLKVKSQINLKKRNNNSDTGFIYKQRKLSSMIKEDILQ